MAEMVSPLAPESYPQMNSIEGVRLFVGGRRSAEDYRNNVLFAMFDEGTKVAGVFTKSKCASAPVEWCKDRIGAGNAGALVVNAGNANAFSGRRGSQATDRTAEMAATLAGCTAEQVFLASTGVIGEPLDAEPIVSEMAKIVAGDTADYSQAALAITTTDTFPKMACRTVRIGDVAVTINAIAKGSGMIAPDMATMLSFVFTDADIDADLLQSMLAEQCEGSFNSITVDSDTSTSDTVLAFATGAAGNRGQLKIESSGGVDGQEFCKALGEVLTELAHLVVKDGEGASKFVEISVDGATSNGSAKTIALSIANSPLVKTAIAGEDANWGRIVMAVGKAGEPADRDQIDIWYGPHKVASAGERDAGYSEQMVSSYMQQEKIDIRVELNIGPGKATVWTCDLTHGYISINADYRS